MSDACYALAHAEYGCGNQVARGRARAIATMGVFPRNSATGGAALPNYLGSTGGSGQCVDRRGFGSEPAYGATVAQAGRHSRNFTSRESLKVPLRCGLILCSCHKRFTVLLLTSCACAMRRQLQWVMPAGLLCKVPSMMDPRVPELLPCPPSTAKIVRQRSATCCGVPWEDSHCCNCARSAACNLIATPVFGMRESIASVGHCV